MPGFLTNTTNVTIEQITSIGNVTDPINFLQNVNNDIYGGLFWFLILWLIAIVMFFAAQKVKDDAPVNNIMYAMAVCSILAVIMRAMQLLTDHQMWVFPIITLLLAVVVWSTKPE